MGAGRSARAAREPDVGWRGFSFPVRSQLPFELEFAFSGKRYAVLRGLD